MFTLLLNISSNRRKYNFKAKSEEQLNSEKSFLEVERAWLVHKDGFSSASQLKSDQDLPEGKVRIQLDYNGDVLEVEEDDVEKANPPGYDKVEDLAQLRYLNESSVLNTLRQRYGNNLIHTYAGPSLISINPMSPLAIYSDKVIQMFKECKTEDMPPHIYSVAQLSYRSMLSTRKDQSIVFIGRSGSGKTTNVKHMLSYFTKTSGNKQVITTEKVNAIYVLLEAFGHSRTNLNSNASRFTELISLDFDASGGLISASIQAMMLEKTRVVRRPDGEPNFNIFYHLLMGSDSSTRKDLMLDNLNEPNLFVTQLQKPDDKSKVIWNKIQSAIKVLGISSHEAHSLWSVLAAIFHLGTASVTRGTMGKSLFARPQAGQKAAQCLGTSSEELARNIFQGTSSTSIRSKSRDSSFRSSDLTNLPDGIDSLHGFVIGLYQEVFNTLIYMINRCISDPIANTFNSVYILDTPGFQNPASCGRIKGACFEELCHNYVQERLQLLFHKRNISSQYEKYLQEQVEPDVGDLDDIGSPESMVSLLDKQPGTRSSQTDLSSTERRGLLWLLDEEALFPGASDETFVERLLLQYNQRGSDELLKRGLGEKQFVLQHFQGTNPVLYNAEGWLSSSREDVALLKAAGNILTESNTKSISELYSSSRGPGSTSVSGSVAGLEGSISLRRASSIRRAFTTGGHAGIKRHSIALQQKFLLDGVLEQLRRTKVHFVQCFLPQHGAGLCDIVGRSASKGSNSSTSSSIGSGDSLSLEANNSNVLMNIPLVRSQVRGGQILDSVRLFKNGYPESIPYALFWRRFHVLGENANQGLTEPPRNVDHLKTAVSEIFSFLDLDSSAYRLGNSQVFLRAGVYAHLEQERDDKLQDQITNLQALCRGYLARKKIQKLKVQDIAIRCIQKNVRKFMGVRGWHWWRLLIKITPMLNVHRTEDQLKSKINELENIKIKLEKFEKDNKEYKIRNERLDAKLSEMTADLAEEHSTATLATERLEVEQTERMKLAKERDDLSTTNKRLLGTNARMETELLYSRAVDLNGLPGFDDVDEDGEPSFYKQKYERAMKELELAKKRLQQQHEDDLEQLMAVKKQLEKKLYDAYEEVDEQRNIVAQWKRKTQKAQGESNDFKHLYEEQSSRNVLLEKKQRKFDAEIASLIEENKKEIVSKEKLQREIDNIKNVKYSLEDQVHALKLDLEFKDEKINALNKELEELHNGGAVEEEIASLKKHKAELDARLMDQEEELDDLAGQVQMLEQSKIKLEMSIAAQKKEHRKELSSKEEELEDARAAAQKRVKALEQQLENEHEERMGFVREKHDLETKIMNLQELASRSTDEEYVIKLKKDLKKTKALLKDAQCMIDKSRNDSSNKIVLRQLKNQLEDAEFAKTAAVKCRQNTEMELTEVQQQLDDVMRSKNDLEDKMMRICREKSDAQTQLEDNEEELSDIMKKYKSAVSQLSVDQITITQQTQQITELEEERHRLKETLSELNQKIDNLESDNISSVTHSRLELKIRELESKLELEQATRGRMETQIGRLKEAIEKYNHECDILRNKELNSQDMARKLQRQLRDSKEDYASLAQKEMETNAKKFEYEKQLELSESEVITVKNDLKIALKRIEHLQTAMQGDLSSETDSVSDGESDMSDDGVDVFLEHHRRAVSVQRERESMARELSAQRELRASMVREMSLKPLETMSEHPEETSPLPEKYIEDEEDTVARSPPAPQKSPSLQLHDEVHLEGGESQA
ncbi:unconventional myosin-XVIIIa isoform X2 [Lepeophtheirus salmonis]|uniref:unconventional myosin-XVIIIa isoform X2 n=1 Tax=Lepeophtheirus salmonis TaxID=72036 RepID=UPI001AE7BEDD|nr:unconventional myosin-XVIIIa-like isoform X2 [Lepeophtheirus salmonis]